MVHRDLKWPIRWAIALTLGVNLIFSVKDISDDVKEGAGWWHIGPELLVVFGTVLVAILALLQVRKFKDRSDRLRHQVQSLVTDNINWQLRTQNYAEGLAKEIDRQLVEWNLSQAEKEVALFLLKGLSNKEIASLRDTSEHTIKQQSSAVYKKSGLTSRAELSAYFLEDLLSPR